MIAKERMYLTADKRSVVCEGDKDASTLYAPVGAVIPKEAADMFGIKDGRISGKSAPPAKTKEIKPAEDKGGLMIVREKKPAKEE